MKPKHPNSQHDLPDFDQELENDAVWNLLGDASSSTPSPRFVQDTLRRTRLENETLSTPWWRSLLSPKPIFAATGLGIAALAIFLSLPDQTPASQPNVVDATPPAENWQELEHAVANELLSDAAEDPSLLSDAEIVALLF